MKETRSTSRLRPSLLEWDHPESSLPDAWKLSWCWLCCCLGFWVITLIRNFASKPCRQNVMDMSLEQAIKLCYFKPHNLDFPNKAFKNQYLGALMAPPRHPQSSYQLVTWRAPPAKNKQRDSHSNKRSLHSLFSVFVGFVGFVFVFVFLHFCVLVILHISLSWGFHM